MAQRPIGALAAQGTPTLVVWGDKDTIFPFAHLASANRLLPHARTLRFHDAGHMPQIEKSEEFAEAITDFWAVEKSELEQAV